MNDEKTHWSKAELRAYILLLCAKADSVEASEELDLIKSKTSPEIFDSILEEIRNDDEDASLKKIEDAVTKLEYSHKELTQLKKEIKDVFYSDGKIQMAEETLFQILDNTMY
ncbi:hypothetical protein K8352_00765 [Flavobacteriaceae bacterium F89]|uniref:Uncharacterized protein n=1 Tax=Cerina litoralis TaxID=2874477 RepID=A0AAE3JR49_9FLAO|nr:hypothetical protein [Cerina litoralis]MCG2459272.1 hypothetical protein [Cerina litoralis]